MKRKSFWLVASGLILVLTVALMAQTYTQIPEIDKNGKPVLPRPTPHVIYSPTDMAHNGATLPASAATPNTNIVRLGEATKMTVFVNCTQAVNLSVNVYTADDQSSPVPNWTLYGTYSLVTTMTAGPQEVFVATELAPSATAGAANPNFRLPQLALSFFETNTTATAGTCTDRVLVGY